MNAEVRKLTYISRTEADLARELPPALRKVDGAKPPAAMADLRLEARIRELQHDREEAQRLHDESIASVREACAQEKGAALAEQREALMCDAVVPVKAAIEAFRQRQESFFTEAEAAIVRLTLSIAARILHREAQTDPLMLRGAVRVALEQARPSSTCIVEVPEGDRELWSRWLKEEMRAHSVEVRGIPDASRGYCRLEIGESAANVSVEEQLCEIERGFLDVLERKNAGAGEGRP